MNILVLVKQVPDPVAIRFDSTGYYSSNTPLVINEYDQFALEEAIQIKESREDVDVTVASVGPAFAKDAVVRGLAMGADRGVLIISDDQRRTSLGTARILADLIADGSFDLVFVGQETSDSGTGNLGPQLAALTNLPFVSNVVDLTFETNSRLVLEREVEDGRQVVATEPPVIICALTGLNEPRYPSLKGIIAARRKPVNETVAGTVGNDLVGISWGELHEEEVEVEGVRIDADPESAAQQVVEILRAKDLL